MISHSPFKIENPIFAIILLSLSLLFPNISYSQNELVFVNNYTNDGVFFENKILINSEFVEFNNNELSIRLSKNNKLLDIQYHPLGIRWSGNIALFEKGYNEDIKILSDDKYSKLGQEITNFRNLLIQNNNAVLKNDSIINFKEHFLHNNLIKSNGSEKILGYKTIKYVSNDSSNINMEAFFGYKLSSEDIKALIKLNAIIQKLSSLIGKTYSINLNFINSQKTTYFPLRVIEFNSNSEIERKEEVIAVQKEETAKNKCKPNKDYQSLSLFDFLLAAKNEISK